MVNLQTLSDVELCRVAHSDEPTKEIQTELYTRLTERNTGVREVEEKKELESRVDDPKTVNFEVAATICAGLLLAQGLFILYVVCPTTY